MCLTTQKSGQPKDILNPSVQFSPSVMSDCDPVNHSTPGLPDLHNQLPESTQTHVHRVGDAIQTSHPVSSPFSACPQSFPASGSFQMSVLHIRWPKNWSFNFNISPSMNIQDRFTLGLTSWISLQSKGFSRVFSNTTVQRYQFFCAQLSL